MTSADPFLLRSFPQTDGCSGAEIVQICQDAALRAMNADLNAPFVRPATLCVLVLIACY